MPVRDLWETKLGRSLDEKDGLRRATDLVERFIPVTVDGNERRMIYLGRAQRLMAEVDSRVAQNHNLFVVLCHAPASLRSRSPSL